MADSASLKEALARLERLGRVLTGDWTEAAHKAGQAGKQEAQTVGRAVTGGSGVLSHMGRGARLGSRYEIKENGQLLEIALRPPGPWVIMTNGAKPHMIRPRGGRGRTVFGGMMFGGGERAIIAPGYAHPVSETHHPGMRQKRGAIDKAFVRMRTVVTPAYHDAMLKQVGALYG
jgi:hypothetical protein